MLWSERLCWPQLCLGNHAFVTVLNVLHSILKVATFVRQRALNCVGSARHMAFQPIWHQVHGLTDLEFMTRHDKTLPAVSGWTGPS